MNSSLSRAVATAVAAALILGVFHRASAQRGAPKAGAQPASSEAMTPFKINGPQADLADLKQRLARARIPDELDGAEWDYGTNRAYLRDLVAYWRDRFDWRAQERRLNRFEQFKTNIDG